MSQSASGQAVAALIAGITSWFIFPVIGGILAIVLGKMEMNAISLGRSPEAGKALAQVGFWLGVINVGMWALSCVGSVLLFFVFPAVFMSIFAALGMFAG